MRLEGIHHVTAITADAPRNVLFYGGLLGLRLVKKTVNFDAPDVYHLYYGDEEGAPGSVLTFFEFPGARPGRPGAGMIHTLTWRVGAEAALDFWEQRLGEQGVNTRREQGRLRFADPEGLSIELAAVPRPDPPLAPRTPEVPEQHALLGFDGVRAYAAAPQASAQLLERGLGFKPAGPGAWEVVGEHRRALYAADRPPARPGVQGAGTIHHIAWSSRDDEEQEAWRERLREHGAHPTPIIDRTYFHSVYFREPGGVLFELATRGPGFAIDEDPEDLGRSLRLPLRYESMREQLERTLAPLPDPRADGSTR